VVMILGVLAGEPPVAGGNDRCAGREPPVCDGND